MFLGSSVYLSVLQAILSIQEKLKDHCTYALLCKQCKDCKSIILFCVLFLLNIRGAKCQYLSFFLIYLFTLFYVHVMLAVKNNLLSYFHLDAIEIQIEAYANLCR